MDPDIIVIGTITVLALVGLAGVWVWAKRESERVDRLK